MKKSIPIAIIHTFFSCFHGIGRKIRPLFEAHGLTGPQYGAMKILQANGAMSPSELSNFLTVTPGNITGIIDRLRKLKFVERRRSSSDRRVLKIALTTEGKKKLEELIPIWESAIEDIFREVPIERQKEFHRTLKEIQESLKFTPMVDFDKEAE
ncbi:MAG: MarR family transcriptional regulator [Candidatus Riflebacteria bacterium]|nr:MarR family transcriptional regulator [Candidatus Riflebacteria bacterium]